jgi:hypothetical protein
MHGHECIRRHDEADSRLAPNAADGGFYFYVALNRRNPDPQAGRVVHLLP